MGKKKYDSDSIERYAGLLGIRKRSNSYIGPNDSDGYWTIIREPLDNCVDLVLKGHNDTAHLIIDKDQKSYYVVDNGPGFPVATKTFPNEHGEPEKLNTLYVATGLVHSGSNFKDDEISRGVHGIGIKASNAMSKRFTVWTKWKNDWWTVDYADAKLVTKPKKCDRPKLPHKIKAKSGTIVRVEPDPKLFMKGSKLVEESYLQWFHLTAYLVPNIKCLITTANGKTEVIEHKNGPLDYLTERVKRLKTSITKPVFQHHGALTDVVLTFTDAEGDNLSAFTNGLNNKDGGEHVRAVQQSMFNTLKAYWPKQKSKDKGQPLHVKDLTDGIVGLVNCKVAAPKFSNQVKDRLIDERIYDKAREELDAAFTKFWKSNKQLANDLVKQAIELRNKTQSFLKDKKLVKNVNAARKKINSKLAGVVGSTPVDKRELFIVEGDSAGGGCLRARDKSFQAVYPLKGKPLNVMDTAKEKVNANTEVIGLIAALGVNLSEKAKADVPYGKIILLADADVDGSHINTLILAIIYRFVPHLLRENRVYSVRSPLYKGRHKGQVYFGMTQQEVWDQAGSKIDLTYLKGWGEVSPDDLGVALDPDKRTLISIGDTDSKGRKTFEQLLGKNVQFRKTLFGIE